MDSPTDTEPQSQTPTPTALQRAIMCILLSSEGCWTVAEVERQLAAAPFTIADALSELRAAGLLNAEGGLVFASAAARAFDALGI